MEFRTFLGKSFSAFFMKSIAAILSLISSLIITRNVSIDEAGSYFLALSVLTFVVPWVSMGLNNTVLKIVAASQEPLYDKVVGGVVGKSILWMFLSSVVVYVSFHFSKNPIGAYFDFNEGFYQDVNIIIPCIFFTASLVLLSHAIQGLGKVSTAIFITGPSQHILFIIFILVLGASSSFDLVVYYFFSAAITAALSITLWLYFSKFNFSLNIKSKMILVTSLPLMLTEVVAATNNSLNNFFLGYWANEVDIAHFSIAFKVATLVSFVLFSVNRVAAPRISSLYSQGKIVELNNLIKWSSKIMVGCAMPVLLVMLIFPEYILSFFGEKYIEAATYLQILAFSQFVCTLTGSVAFLLIMSGNAKAHRNNVIISFVVGLILSVFLIKNLGALGAAISVSISLSLTNILSWLDVKRILKINTVSCLVTK